MNSRLRISNQLELADQAQFYVARAARKGTRAILIIDRPPEGWLETFAQLCECEYLGAHSSIDRADRISALLGSERLLSIVQLNQKPDLGLLAAAAGSVKAGGLLVIGTHARPCAGSLSINESTNAVTSLADSNHSNQRLERLAALSATSHPDTVRCVEVITDVRGTSVDEKKDAIRGLAACLKLSESRPLNAKACAEQDALLDQACNHLNSNISSCIVIKGRRGRGKSSLLARLAMHLDKTGMDFRITAMHESALRTYSRHTNQTETRYVSPEAALKESVDVLLVDEAASISLTQLQGYLNHYRHVILSTTIDGYEASGRAFDVRLLSDWSHKSMKLLQLEARQPWRWTDNDPLEQFTDQLLLNKMTQQPKSFVQPSSGNVQTLAGDCQLMQVSQNELVGDESLLSSVHSLLHTTHYQTTTKDLEHLLDAPTVQLWIQMLDRDVVGVLVLEQEGVIENNLHEAILAKKRRLPNQLLPQLLAQTANTSAALEKRYLRIIRLAVTSELRRQKLASKLLHAVTSKHTAADAGTMESIRHPKTDAIGASFASDECSIKFWKSHGYTEFHRGFRSNPRTGKKAVAMMQGFEQITADVLSTAAQINHDNEMARYPKAAHSENQLASQKVSARDTQLLRRFAAGHRSKHDTYASLQRLSMLASIPANNSLALSARQHELELRRCVQQWIGTQS